MTNKQMINGVEVDLDNPSADRAHPAASDTVIFVAGDLVQFRGLIVGSIQLKPFRGRLRESKNASVRDAVTIDKDPQKLVFNPNGSLYCHAHHGILLEKVREIPANKGGKRGKQKV